MEAYDRLSNEMATHRPSFVSMHGAGAFKDAARVIESMEVQMKEMQRELEWQRKENARLHELLSGNENAKMGAVRDRN